MAFTISCDDCGDESTVTTAAQASTYVSEHDCEELDEEEMGDDEEDDEEDDDVDEERYI